MQPEVCKDWGVHILQYLLLKVFMISNIYPETCWVNDNSSQICHTKYIIWKWKWIQSILRSGKAHGRSTIPKSEYGVFVHNMPGTKRVKSLYTYINKLWHNCFRQWGFDKWSIVYITTYFLLLHCWHSYSIYCMVGNLPCGLLFINFLTALPSGM